VSDRQALAATVNIVELDTACGDTASAAGSSAGRLP